MLREQQAIDAKAAMPNVPVRASSVDSKPLAVPVARTVVSKTPPAPRAGPEDHNMHPLGNRVRVRRGDSLWRIAKRYLGRGNNWPKIAAVNPELADPNRIRAGQLLRLPPHERPARRCRDVGGLYANHTWNGDRA